MKPQGVLWRGLGGELRLDGGAPAWCSWGVLWMSPGKSCAWTAGSPRCGPFCCTGHRAAAETAALSWGGLSWGGLSWEDSPGEDSPGA